MNDAPAATGTIWQTQGNYEYEVAPDGNTYTDWYRCRDGRAADGRLLEHNHITGETRESRTVFPGGATQMLATELPVHWLGYVADDACNLGMEALEGRPGFIGQTVVVYAVPGEGHTATLERKPGGGTASFELRLPPGQDFGGRSTFWVVFPDFYN